MHQEPKGAAAVSINKIEQIRAFFVDPPGATGFEAENLADAERGFVARKILRRDAIPREVLTGDVNAAERGVFMDITNDVSELKRQTKFLGKVECAGIAIAKNVRAGKTDSSRDTVAIFAQAVEGRVGLDGEVHFRAGDQVMQIPRRHVVAPHGIDKGGQDFPFTIKRFFEGFSGRAIEKLRTAGDRFIKSRAPLGETLLRGLQIFP